MLSPAPPQRENVGVFAGYPNPTILATCALLGVDEVCRRRRPGDRDARLRLRRDRQARRWQHRDSGLRAGSLITGPGSIWVTAAKRLVQGLVGIDAEAGPTEIAVLADDSADPEHVAADLLSQAEHDPLAASVLVTVSEALADAVDAALARRVPDAKHGRAHP